MASMDGLNGDSSRPAHDPVYCYIYMHSPIKGHSVHQPRGHSVHQLTIFTSANICT